jgi:Skp family chaperone for outer membrane proteins
MFFITRAFSFEIPISGAVECDDSNISGYKEISSCILYVDMEKVFNSHPNTQNYKKEIKEFAKTRKTIIEEMIKEFNAIKEKAKDTHLRMSEALTVKDERLVGDLSKQFENAQNLIREQKAKIADMSDRTKEEIALMEERNTANILKDIEFLLKKVSRKYNADVILEKQSVLTGRCKDITDEVIKMSKDR